MILNDNRATWMLVALVASVAAITCGCSDSSSSATSEYQFRGFNELIGVPLNKAEQKFAGRYSEVDLNDQEKITSELILRRDHTYTYLLRYRDYDVGENLSEEISTVTENASGLSYDDDGNSQGEIISEVYHGVWAVTGDFVVFLDAYAEPPGVNDEYFDELIPSLYKVDSWEKVGYQITQDEEEYNVTLQGVPVESFEFEQMQKYNSASAIESAGEAAYQKMRERIPTLLGPKGKMTANQEFANSILDKLPAATPEQLVESVLEVLASDEKAKMGYFAVPTAEELVDFMWKSRPERFFDDTIDAVKRELSRSKERAQSRAESDWNSIHESVDVDWNSVSVEEIKYDISIDDSRGIDMKVTDIEVMISALGEKLSLKFNDCIHLNGRWYFRAMECNSRN